ncbi:hypothetical protein Tco_1287712, partial [Tanacetum coccineum]
AGLGSIFETPKPDSTRYVQPDNPITRPDNTPNCNTGTTSVLEKIGKFKDLLTSGQAILVDDTGFRKGGFGTQSLLEQWRDSYGNGDYDVDPYDDDMYEGQDLTQELQAICDNLDIRVRGRKKKQFYVFSFV